MEFVTKRAPQHNQTIKEFYGYYISNESHISIQKWDGFKQKIPKNWTEILDAVRWKTKANLYLNIFV